MDKKGIVVYCASSDRVDDKYKALAREVGRLIVENGFYLINGGGRLGLMKETIDGVVEAGGEAIGVLPDFMNDRGWGHDRLTSTIVTPGMHPRKAKMAEMSVAAIALPGGIGTLDELCEIMTWRQLGLYKHPVVILNLDGFYDPLIQMFDKMHALNFMRDNSQLCTVVATAAEALEAIIRENNK
ncbi:MAG: TIGR00730 family Rossman fold protein [Lachnoclostridium sp.]|nr:TIGR00730 family Rossman fold protein [Lachnoclostridium sp.]